MCKRNMKIQDRQCMYKYNIESCLNHHCWSGKASSIHTLSMSVAFVIQHVKHKQHIILLTVACQALPYFTHYLTNGTIFGKKLLNIICVFLFFLQCLSETLLMLRRIQCVSMINAPSSSCKVTAILVRFNKTWIFLKDFGKTLNIKFHKNLFSGKSDVPHRQIDRHFKANSAFFCNFSNAPKNRQG
jgi:hypothetical protein